jgi:hypothetical protein
LDEKAWTYAVIGWAVGFLCGIIVSAIIAYWLLNYILSTEG